MCCRLKGSAHRRARSHCPHPRNNHRGRRCGSWNLMGLDIVHFHTPGKLCCLRILDSSRNTARTLHPHLLFHARSSQLGTFPHTSCLLSNRCGFGTPCKHLRQYTDCSFRRTSGSLCQSRPCRCGNIHQGIVLGRCCLESGTSSDRTPGKHPNYYTWNRSCRTPCKHDLYHLHRRGKNRLGKRSHSCRQSDATSCYTPCTKLQTRTCGNSSHRRGRCGLSPPSQARKNCLGNSVRRSAPG
mmetsp:Transcript_20366/g.47504  ORF Transcript_20366/g.47504 Transcript_20366/m.47504 type:complete len:240 (-) Transcript_20366:769-1488(-)